METMFDGFEDYDYQSDCGSNECTPKRHADFGDIQSYIVSNEKHSGRYSLMVTDNDSVLLKGDVITQSLADTLFGFDMEVPLQSCPDSVYVVSKYEGTGFVCSGASPCPSLTDTVDNSEGGSPVRTWRGYLIPETSGEYKFLFKKIDDEVDFKVTEKRTDGTDTIIENVTNLTGIVTRSVNLVYGKIYEIEVKLHNSGSGPYSLIFKWQTPPMLCAGISFDFIPNKYIYASLGTARARTSAYRIFKNYYSLNTAGITGYGLNRKLTLLRGKKMILSAWVKEAQLCKTPGYENNNIGIYFDGSHNATFTPTGNIIEGWQRYEAEFIVPPTAQNFAISLKSSSGSVYFDDIRMHPFNANEKSFVYNSTNMRLMAELDENNYASFYEYDDEGTLTRVKKETQRGIKTIQETKSVLTQK